MKTLKATTKNFNRIAATKKIKYIKYKKTIHLTRIINQLYNPLHYKEINPIVLYKICKINNYFTKVKIANLQVKTFYLLLIQFKIKVLMII
jgi:hypothetical protein